MFSLSFFLPSKKGSRKEVFWLTPWTFRKYGFGTSRKHLITFLTFKFHFHNQSLVWIYYCVNSVIGKGIEPHPTNGYHSVSFLSTLEKWCVHYLWRPVMPFEWSRVRNLSSLSYLYYNKTCEYCQVLFEVSLLFFRYSTPSVYHWPYLAWVSLLILR